MNQIHIWQIRWSTGDVLIADHKLQQDNEIIIEHGQGSGSYYLSGIVAYRFPIESMPTKDGHTIKVRAIPLIELEKEELPL